MLAFNEPGASIDNFILLSFLLLVRPLTEDDRCVREEEEDGEYDEVTFSYFFDALLQGVPAEEANPPLCVEVPEPISI